MVPFLDPSPHSATKARISPTGLFSERLFFFWRPPLLGTGSEAEDAATPSTRRSGATVWGQSLVRNNGKPLRVPLERMGNNGSSMGHQLLRVPSILKETQRNHAV